MSATAHPDPAPKPLPRTTDDIGTVPAAAREFYSYSDGMFRLSLEEQSGDGGSTLKHERPAEPEPAPLEVEVKRRKPWVMTPETETKILASVAAGVSLDTAARLHGVNPSTARSHKAACEEFRKRWQEADAQSEFELTCRQRKHAEKSSRACGWLLERKWPERWASPETQAEMRNQPADEQTIVRGIRDLLGALTAQHADLSQPDVEDTEDGQEFAELSVQTADAADGPATDDDVTRS